MTNSNKVKIIFLLGLIAPNDSKAKSIKVFGISTIYSRTISKPQSSSIRLRFKMGRSNYYEPETKEKDRNL